jgi:hypothetical protein
VKIEKLRSTQQWELEINDISRHGPNGFPKPAVMKAFKVHHTDFRLYCFTISFFITKYALQQFVGNSEQDGNLKAGGDAPALEAHIEGEGAIVLVLYVPVMGMHVEFTFRFFPVALETTAIFETQLRDAEEEIERLKGEITKLKGIRNDCIVLSSKDDNSDGQFVRWNILIYNTSPAVFRASPGHQEVRILSDGLYQICCRYQMATRGGSLVVRINQMGIATICSQSEPTLSICVFVPLKEKDVLSVSSGHRGYNPSGREENELSIMKLM